MRVVTREEWFKGPPMRDSIAVNCDDCSAPMDRWLQFGIVATDNDGDPMPCTWICAACIARAGEMIREEG